MNITKSSQNPCKMLNVKFVLNTLLFVSMEPYLHRVAI